MKRPRYVLGCAVALVSAQVSGAGSSPTLHDLMKNVVAVQTQIVWDVGNHAQDEEGKLSAAKMKEGDWSRVIAAGSKVAGAALGLAKTARVRVAAPGQKIQDEGNPGASNTQAVQTTIDANPRSFAAFAQVLATTMDEVVAAAKLRDAAKLGEVSDRLDQVCEQCHAQFWYPQQKP